MKITDAKVIVCSPGRNFVTLKIVTEDGLTGLGDATLNGRELAVATYLSEHVVPLLIGRDARRIEDTWHYLYKGVYWRKGAVTMTAIAAVDMALWDIAGKAANKPVYQLFGGASREDVLVYSHANGATLERDGRRRSPTTQKPATGRFARSARCPGRSTATASAKAGARYEPAERGGCRRRARGAPSRTCSSRRCSSSACGASSAPSIHLLHDVHHRLRPIEAARLGKSLEPYHLFWMEDPVAGRAPGRIPHDSAAHDDADCGRRSLRQHL